jgi:hypothetical protein
LYPSPNIITIIKSRRMRWARHVARMRPTELIWSGNPIETDHLEDQGLDGDSMDVRWEGANWIDLIQDRGRWRALVNTVMNLPFL